MGSVYMVKAITPKTLRSVGGVRLELLNAMRKEGTVQKKLLAGTVRYWPSKKPEFTSLISLSGGDEQLLVGPSGNSKSVEIWNGLDGGTNEHDVYPVRAQYLRFQPNYTAGSKPNTLVVTPSRKWGDYVYAKHVRVKGIKPRNWTIVVLKQRYIPFKEAMNKALARGLEREGWK